MKMKHPAEKSDAWFTQGSRDLELVQFLRQILILFLFSNWLYFDRYFKPIGWPHWREGHYSYSSSTAEKFHPCAIVPRFWKQVAACRRSLLEFFVYRIVNPITRNELIGEDDCLTSRNNVRGRPDVLCYVNRLWQRPWHSEHRNHPHHRSNVGCRPRQRRPVYCQRRQ